MSLDHDRNVVKLRDSIAPVAASSIFALAYSMLAVYLPYIAAGSIAASSIATASLWIASPVVSPPIAASIA